MWRCLFECHAAHDKDCVNDSRPQNCERNAPRICWHTIFTCGNSERYGKPLKQRGFLPRSGGHSSSYWYQQGQVPRLGRRVDFPAARVVAALRAHDRACSDGRAPTDPPEIALKLVPFIVPKKLRDNVTGDLSQDFRTYAARWGRSYALYLLCWDLAGLCICRFGPTAIVTGISAWFRQKLGL